MGCSQNKVLEIHQQLYFGKLDSSEIENRQKVIESKSGTVYLEKNDEYKKATIQMNSGMIIDVWGDFTDAEFIEIIDNLNPMHI